MRDTHNNMQRAQKGEQKSIRVEGLEPSVRGSVACLVQLHVAQAGCFFGCPSSQASLCFTSGPKANEAQGFPAERQAPRNPVKFYCKHKPVSSQLCD